jgi:transposase
METEMEDKCICPNCGEKMNRSENTTDSIFVCPECGCSIDADNQFYGSDDLCPNCNQLMEEGNECSYCGYDLGTDFD